MLNPMAGGPMVGGALTPDRLAGPRRLMVVGDAALSRSLFDMVLTRLGYAITCTASGEEAIAAFGHTRFALALIALELPDLPGMALARRLRGMPGAVGRTPIMLFGDARDLRAVHDGCREAGLQGFLPKPISIGRLVSSVCDLVRTTVPPGGEAMTTPRNVAALLERLHEFTDGDEQLERELVSLYLSTAALYLDELRARLGRAEDWRSTAHALKGASVNIGALDLAQLAAEAEQAGPCPDRLAGLEDALALIRDAFRGRWSTEPPRQDALARSS